MPDLSSEARDIVEIQDGFVLAGRAVHSVTGSDGLIMQLDVTGNVVWEKTYDLDGDEIFKSIVAAGDGGFVVIGESQPSANIWVLKVDAIGNILWQFQIDRPNGGSTANRVLAVPGGFILSGLSGSNNGVSGSYLARINTSGQILWERTYETPVNNIMTIGHITDSLWYVSGGVGLNASFMAVDPQTGTVEQSIEFAAPGSEILNDMVPTPDGNLILSGLVQPFWPNNAIYVPWLKKISPAGAEIWSNAFYIQGEENMSGPVVPLPTGGYLVCPVSGSNAPSIDAYLMKLDEGGQVIWCRSYGKPNDYDWFNKGLPTSDGGIIAAGVTSAAVPGRTNIFVIKLNAEGTLNDCCNSQTNVVVENFLNSSTQSVITAGSFFPETPAFGVADFGNNPEQAVWCNHPLPGLQIQYSLCPGETILLNGQEYAAPDTLITNVPGASGDCDTVVTYYLLDETLGQSSQIQMQCPPDIVSVLVPGASSVSVDYTMPVATTDCTCGGLILENLSGGVSGSSFPLGSHPVCWQAEDACGNSSACCFTVTVEEEGGFCDSKTNTCLTWELLDRRRTTSDEVAYRIRITNQCSSKLKFAYMGTPSGILPLEPIHNSIYETSASREYLVRNPNFSPFYGLRFLTLTEGIHDGESDVFRMVLPIQTSPDYLHVAAKLDNGTYLEAHLNTFDCPIGDEKNSVERVAITLSDANRISLSPNPLIAGKPLQIEGVNLVSGRIKLFNTYGQEIFQGNVVQNLVLEDTSWLPAGLCFFQVFDESLVAIFGGVLVVSHD
ncbi:MAG: HYR domain-containing protein [Saprospiraceae bacterium]|nr:HYR domain-containing protein [Saprospiraceae bacterium]